MYLIKNIIQKYLKLYRINQNKLYLQNKNNQNKSE